MTCCICEDSNPLRGMGYMQASNTATKLYSNGWRQSRCPDCERFTIWRRGGVRWVAGTATKGNQP